MWWIPAVAQGIGAVMNSRSQRNQASSLNQLKKLTPEELKYQERLQSRAEKGDPNLGKMQNRIIGNVRQQGQLNQQRATGQSIQQGLENSIVAQELRRRTDTDTMRQIAEESRRLAEHNTRYKENAQDKLDGYNMQRSQYLRDISMQQSQMRSQADQSLIGGLVGAVGTGASAWDNQWTEVESGSVMWNKRTGKYEVAD